MATSDAPMQIGRVALTVNDLAGTGDFYQRVIGLQRLSGSGGELMLGADDRALLELREDRAARPQPREAGLFHTAFLLPSRAALGSWLRFAVARDIALDGASDHLVSEALYLRDPEGNGIEIYVDRPRDQWLRQGAEVVMDTRPLDARALLAAGRDGWRSAAPGTIIGHVHLQVGALAEAEAFCTDRLRMKRSAHMPGASFFASGGYHHHLAANIWHSRGAARRSAGATGLAELVLAADADLMARLDGDSLTDPWGTRFRIEAKP